METRGLELRFPENAAPLAVVGAAAAAELQINASIDASLPSHGVPMMQLPDGYAQHKVGVLLLRLFAQERGCEVRGCSLSEFLKAIEDHVWAISRKPRTYSTNHQRAFSRST